MKFYWLCIVLVQIECVNTQDTENDCQLNSFSSVPMVGHNSHLSKHHHDGSILDGCKHVYLDVGSNMGIQVRKLFEPDLYFKPSDKSSVIHRYIEYFGTNKTDWRSDVCAIGFEPNPAHTLRLKQLARRYSAHGWRTTFIFAAASDHNSISTYGSNSNTLQAAGKLKHKDCIKKTSSEVLSQNNNSSHQPVKIGGDVNVPVIDFGQFLFQQIKHRKIPSSSSSSTTKANVLAKLDIEGAEYDVTNQLVLLNSGSKELVIDDIEGKNRKKNEISVNVTNQMLDIVDRYMIEWHTEKQADHIRTFKNWTSSLFQDKWERLDDETFKFDPFPLPVRLNKTLSSSHHKSGSIPSDNVDPWSTLNVKDHGAFWRDNTNAFSDHN